MANRVLDSAERYTKRIARQQRAGVDLSGRPIGPALEALDKTMALAFDEHFAFQNAQARAHAMGRLTTEEATTVYAALGETVSTTNGGWSAHVGLPLKLTITQLMGELIAA